MSLTGSNNEEKIWNYLYSKIGNAYGVAGLMGNLQAESGLEPTNLQDSYEKKLGYTDGTYTAAVDDGSYTNFVKDSAGYGLAQWTYYSRKQGLLDYVQSKKASIGDLECQLKFLYNELSSDFSSVLSSLKSATSVKSASDIVLTKFEQPADQGSSVQTTRANYGQTFYDKYASSSSSSTTTTSLGDYDKYIYSSGTHYISNCGHDENGKYSGGTAGDQTGEEWYLRSWYNRPWNCVLRYPDEAVALKLAELGCAAALNDKIGYDQSQRDTYWTQLKANSYDPSKITTACEADCSSGIIANTKAVGYLMGISALQNVSATYTGDMRSGFKNAGFTVLTDSKYLTDTAYLQPGDILLNDSAHTATNITNGSKSSFSGTGTSSGTTSSGSGSGSTTSTVSIDTADYFNKSIAGKYTVTASSLYLRSGANTSKTIIASMPKGSTVQCYGYYSITNKVNWLLVEYISGSTTYTGFCSSEYLNGGSTTSGTTTSSSNPLYYVQVKVSDLRIRTGAGTNCSWTGKYTGVGVFGIVEEKSGTGASKWGKLLSGAGWISLDYATKI